MMDDGDADDGCGCRACLASGHDCGSGAAAAAAASSSVGGRGYHCSSSHCISNSTPDFRSTNRQYSSNDDVDGVELGARCEH